MANTTIQNLASLFAIGILTMFLTACNVKNSQTNQPKIINLYPIYSRACQAIPSEKQPIFLANLQQLKKGMTSNEVVKLLDIEPNFYRQNDDKRLNAPIEYYHMDYSFDCADVVGNASIWLKFSTDEKLLEVEVGKDVNIAKMDSSLIFSKFQH